MPVTLGHPPSGASYPLLLRGRRAEDQLPGLTGPVAGLLGIFTGLMLFLLLAGTVSQAVRGIEWLLLGGGVGFADWAAGSAGSATWLGMLADNLGLTVLIAIAILMVTVLHRTRPGYLASVVGGVRWRYLLACVLWALPVFGASWAIGQLAGGGFPGWRPEAGALGFLVVVVLTSPLQATAEEVFFRGYLMQGIGLLVARPWVGVVGSALVFALFHGTQNPWLFGVRFVFGLAAGLLVWRTGGLEAAVGAHIVNNVLAFGIGTATGTIAELRSISELDLLAALGQILPYVVFALGAVWIARRMRVQVTS